MKQLDYDIMYNEIATRLNENSEIVLATCDKNNITARTVFYISNGLTIYFLTSTAYTKYKQIQKNKNVALCFKNVQIQGKAEILGHPLEEANQKLMLECPNCTELFLSFQNYKNSALIKVEVENVECWKNDGREYLNVLEKTSFRIG